MYTSNTARSAVAEVSKIGNRKRRERLVVVNHGWQSEHFPLLKNSMVHGLIFWEWH